MLANSVLQFFEVHGIGSDGIVAAVSGGVDSTALLLVLADLRPRGTSIAAAHVNHHLRGEDSEADERFVRAICERLGVQLHVAEGALPGELVRHHGVEAAAREVRTRALLDIRARLAARWVATAHQKNDQAETILMRLATGTGLAGLRGIHPAREDGFIRPLLAVSRSEIEEFLRLRGVEPRQDRMNDDPRFLRTTFRRLVRELPAAAIDELTAIAADASRAHALVERALDGVEDVVATPTSTLFRSLPDDPFLRRALLLRHVRRLDGSGSREVSAAALERLAAEADRLRRVSVTKHLELVRGAGLELRRRATERPAPFALPIRAGEEVFVVAAGVSVRVERAAGPETGTPSRQRFQLPPGAAAEFVLRSRRPGDRFHPLGAPGERKLKDFLIDRKVPREERDRLPLLVWNSSIVWVSGLSVSEQFRIRDSEGERFEVALNGEE